MTDRSHAMQMLCVWVALLQPFAALSDMAVLSSCVPCMSLIALVSTTSPDTEVQYSFLVFIAAATFLMVHENYLRTRSHRRSSGPYGRPRERAQAVRRASSSWRSAASPARFCWRTWSRSPCTRSGRSLSLANGWGRPSSLHSGSSSLAGAAGHLANDDKTLAIGDRPGDGERRAGDARRVRRQR